VPRVLPSLHPSDSVVDSGGQFTMGGYTAVIFFSSLAAFTGLFIWIYRLTMRIVIIERKIDEESLT
jgi:hypothetical protein